MEILDLNKPRLRYATTFLEMNSEKSSPYSVLPIKPYYEISHDMTISIVGRTSSASQLANTMVLAGFHPDLRSFPRPLIVS